MSILPGKLLDATRILFDLQQANEIAQSFSGCLEPESIARCVTEGIVDRFHCAFARIWLLESDQAMLRLVASSGMYTRTDGFFARVPMGAYKVGKIAQNRISFLSNNLAAEPWVGNRDWAVANQIRGFAGYPLVIGNRVIGVLAMFSRHALEPEFLEVLQTLCTIATIALDTAMQCQKEKQSWQMGTSSRPPALANQFLSDQLAEILTETRLTLVGTEESLSLSKNYLFLKTAEILKPLRCAYGRLIYSDTETILEAIVPGLPASPGCADSGVESSLRDVRSIAIGLGGIVQASPTPDQRGIQITLSLPHRNQPIDHQPIDHQPISSNTTGRSRLRLQIHCLSPALQFAFTHLAQTAKLTVCEAPENAADIPILTDNLSLATDDRPILWVQHQSRFSHTASRASLWNNIRARLDLSIQPDQLCAAVEAVMQGQTWGMESITPSLSDRELEILSFLTQGFRDRDIADRLIISESTVKFHLNNAMTKLKARTRYQAIYQAIEQGWI
ncbi:helix-turn-helix transcriptional regulator [Leptolyngbya ohadii]|uniref:helix-turn-helix transcriptional regulator n=1 Tax=Leptolyngbya ohadii TaxID=1962290 RepID=UPI000B59D4B2|nr:LuxR C-terminal-related transcriptional regulator [Leptolyngbya ohadii]